VELLNLKGVTKVFSHYLVLENINLSIEEGDIYGIIGKSGSGKSTLLNLIVGFVQPEEGSIVYYSSTGKPKKMSSNSLSIKKNIGYNPEHLSFYPKLTVKENLLHFGRMYHIKEKVLIDNAKNLLEFTGLYKYRNYLAEELSGGMQKRLDIACSLIHKPKLLVLDEPVMHLDPKLKNEILSLIKEVNRQGITVVLTSHDLDAVEAVCSKVAILHNKKVHSSGTLDAVKAPFSVGKSTISLKAGKYHDLVLDFARHLQTNNLIDNNGKIIMETENLPATANHLVSLIAKKNLPLNHLELSEPSLKQIFEKVTKEEKV